MASSIVALLSYLHDFNVASFELTSPFLLLAMAFLADVGLGTTLSSGNSQAKEKKLSISR